jgi:hypothetical protein
MYRLIAVGAALFALTGCAMFSSSDGLTPSMDRLVGHPAAEVAIILGPPANNADAGGGKRTFQWARYAAYQTADVGDRVGKTLNDTPPPGRTPQCLVVVTAVPARAHARTSVLGDWTVQSWEASGTDCH